MNRTQLDQLARSCTGPFAFCGIALSHEGRRSFHIGTASGISASADSLFRCASISKIVTGRVLWLAAKKAGIDLGGAPHVAELLGWDGFNPAGPVSLAMLLSHQAGLQDLIVPPNVRLADWFHEEGASLFHPDPPGTRFSYSNTGYVLVAAAVETLTNRRFDQYAKEAVLEPLGITAGFNWSGLGPEERADALPTYRRSDGGFSATVDAKVPADGIIGPDARPYDLTGYRPGHNPAPFAPQGGLRISLRGLLALSESLSTHDHTPYWTPQMGPMDGDHEVLESYGAGLQIFDHSSFYPNRLIGHAACAYGMKGGVWLDKVTGASFAYVLNGLPQEPDSDAFEPEELQIFRAMAQAVA